MMNPNVEFDFEEKHLIILLPEGWKVTAMGPDSGVGLELTTASHLRVPSVSQLVEVAALRVEPAPTVAPKSAGDA